MKELDLLIIAICFSALGYGLCYMTLAVNHKAKTQKVDSKGV